MFKIIGETIRLLDSAHFDSSRSYANVYVVLLNLVRGVGIGWT